MQKIVIALDAGTTGVRSLALDLQGKCLYKEYSEIKRSFPNAGWVEQDANEIWGQLKKCLIQLYTSIKNTEVVGIGITNQRETVVAWDRESGQPLTPAIVWQCRRTADYCEKNQNLSAMLSSKTGLLLDPYFSATKMHWMLHNVSAVAKAKSEGRLCFGTVDSWILYQLSGKKVWQSEPSNASRTLLYNIHSNEWDKDLLNTFGVDRASLPEIFPSIGSCGNLDETILGKAFPVTAMLGDQQASLFGHAGWKEGVVKCTYGTGLFIMSRSPHPLHIHPKLLTTVAWQYGAHIETAFEGALFNGGACIQWLRDGLGLIKTSAECEEIAKSVPDSGEVYFSPALTGLGAPYWDPKARGSFVGMSSGTTRAHLIRAVLESLAYQVRSAVELLDGGASELHCDGGATANEFLMQFQADVLGIPVVVARESEATALGVAAAAALGAGVVARKELENWNPEKKRYLPQKLNLDKNYKRWQEAVNRSLSWAV